MRWFLSALACPLLALAVAIVLQAIPAGARPGQAGEPVNEAPPDVTSFVAGFEALPLMPGLQNVAGSGVVFETPTCRIVESTAAGITTPEAIEIFYAQSLPQLGWERFSETKYRRENEILNLEIVSDADHVVVHFFLSPK